MKFIKLPKVKDLTGLGKSSIYAMMADGKFPANIRIGSRAVAWDSDQIECWMKNRIESSLNNS